MTKTQLLKKLLEVEKIDPRIVSAMGKVPREAFVPDEWKENAYIDAPIPIGFGQTTSQPTIIAEMIQMLDPQPTDIVLEVGTGSGYQTAILCELAKFVYSIERIGELARKAEETLKKLGYTNYKIIVGDGSKGLPEYAPFDKIIVSAAAPEVPKSLISQLSPKGAIVIPIGNKFSQTLMKLEKTPDGNIKIKIGEFCRFVPLIGEEGWEGPEE